MKKTALEPSSAAGRIWWWLALAAVLVGAALRLWQWALGTSLFIDELAVLHNVATRPVGELLSTPLGEAQVAPPLFLLAEKACLAAFGPSELGLRLPALLGSLAALLLLWAVARRVLAAPLVPLVLLAFGVGFTFIYYSSQVKQYASDAAGSLLVVWLALRLRQPAPPTARFWGLAAVGGAVLPFYSQSSVLVLAGCGMVLVLLAALDAGRPRLRPTLLVVGAWAVGCGASLALAERILRPITREFMHFFWREGMLPLSGRLPQVFVGDLTERWANGLGWPHPSVIWVGLSAVGIVLLWRRQRETTLLLLAPWLLSGLAAALQQFPLRGRLMDFLLPSMLLFVFSGWQGIVSWAGQLNQKLGLALVALALVPIVYSTTHHNLPPYRLEDTKTLLSRLAQLRRPTDGVYAYYGAGQALRWYGPQMGLSPGSYRLGHCYLQQPAAERQYLPEVDAFRGRRVWLLMVHFDSYDSQVLTAYLDSIGRRGPRLVLPRQMPDATDGYPFMYFQLYDLTDARRAARYTAATFPLPPPPARRANEICWSCYGPQVLAASQPTP